MFVSHSEIQIPAADVEPLERAFRERARRVDGHPGFLGLELLREVGNRGRYLLVTRWESREDLTRRVAAVIWRAVPYYPFRYGERGRKFGLSDGGWLITLATYTPERRLQQVEWLTKLLAARAMPSWLMELQLRATVVIGRRLGWHGAAAIASVGEHLAARRRAVLSDERFAEAGRTFGRGRLADGTGKLIASAYADTAIGWCASPAPVTTWLADPAVFPPPWRDAVARTVRLFDPG